MVTFDFSSRFYRSGHYTVLLLALILYLFVLPPVVHGHTMFALLLRVGVTFVLFAACYAIATNRKAFRATVVLAVLAALAGWTAEFVAYPLLARLESGLAAAFFAWTVLLLLQHVLGEAPVTLDKLFGAICIYLLMGLAWAGIFALIHEIDPASFAMSDAVRSQLKGSHEAHSIFLYYSFVTLTTVGYGDISPVSLGARSMAALEAVVGPLYLAILIARLVSLMDLRGEPRGP